MKQSGHFTTRVNFFRCFWGTIPKSPGDFGIVPLGYTGDFGLLMESEYCEIHIIASLHPRERESVQG